VDLECQLECPLYTSHLIAGTVFYFAVESEDELPLWMDCITLATFKQDFSETGQESEGGVFLPRCQCLFLRVVVVVVVSKHCLGFASQVFCVLGANLQLISKNRDFSNRWVD
jgi:hypothetical protein